MPFIGGIFGYLFEMKKSVSICLSERLFKIKKDPSINLGLWVLLSFRINQW
jgi:hypothetical protein